MSQQTAMSRSTDHEDGCFVAMDTEDDGAEPTGVTGDCEAKMGSCQHEGNMDTCAKEGGRTMVELPEEVLEYILSFLSPYQEHKTAALVCKQWYRLIKGRNSQGSGPIHFGAINRTMTHGCTCKVFAMAALRFVVL